jgi:hypothetical protein
MSERLSNRAAPHLSCRSLSLAAAVLFPLILFAPAWLAEPAATDVTGTWLMTVEAPEGIAHPTILLKQEGEKITGTYRGRMGESELSGTIKGSEIRFSVTLKFQDVSYVVVFSGSVGDDSMKGTARFGDTGTGDWSAKRKKRPA